jgi:CHASE1-domain containing sensor protein
VVLLLVDLSAAVVVQQVHQEQAQAVLAARAISMLAVLVHQEQELLLAVVEAWGWIYSQRLKCQRKQWR